jgi:hypothetical protein
MKTVKILSPKDLGYLRVYPAYLDPFSQLITQPSLQTLRRKLYADAIMNEHIIPSLSHILGSNATTQLILNEPELLDEKIIVPFISQPYTSVDKYVDGHLYDFEKDKKVYGDLGISLNMKSYKFHFFKIYPARQSIDQKPIDELIKLKRDFFSKPY